LAPVDMQLDLATETILAVTVVIAAVSDLLYSRVPNWLTFPVTILALALHFVDAGTQGLLFSAGGWLTGFALLIGFYALGGSGAGDVKLLAAVGALSGSSRVFSIFLYSALFGGVYALGIVVYSIVSRTGWADAGRRLRVEGTSLFLTGGSVQPLAASVRTYPKLRYAIVIALGLAAEHMFGPLRFQ
jgi:prepilin peptidase CpaA